MRARMIVVVLATLLASCGGSSTEAEEPMPEPTPEPTPPPPPPPDEPVASPPQPEPPPEPPPPPPPRIVGADEAFQGMNPPPAAWLTCTADTDCAVVEVGCCDHCNGGKVVSVVTRQSNAAQRRYRPRRCNDPCTERGCAAAEPVCQEGRCAFRALWMTGEAAPAAPAPATPAPTPAP